MESEKLRHSGVYFKGGLAKVCVLGWPSLNSLGNFALWRYHYSYSGLLIFWVYVHCRNSFQQIKKYLANSKHRCSSLHIEVNYQNIDSNKFCNWRNSISPSTHSFPHQHKHTHTWMIQKHIQEFKILFTHMTSYDIDRANDTKPSCNPHTNVNSIP